MDKLYGYAFKKIIFNSDPHSSYMQTEDTEHRKKNTMSLMIICKKLFNKNKFSTTECWKMTGEKLWENIGREIMLSNIRDEKVN